MPLVIGIDPGLHGAIAYVDGSSSAARLMPLLPGLDRDDYDEDALRMMLLPAHEAALVVHEKLGSLPAVRADGKALGGGIGNHRRGLACGIIRGLLAGLEVPLDRRIAVVPQVWQRALLEGLPCGGDTKTRSVWLAQRLFPNVPLIVGRRRTPHDGIADALCLAEYGRRVLAGDKGRQRGLLEVSA